MKLRNFLLFSFFCLPCMRLAGQCAKIPGTLQLSDTVGIKATEITVYDYTSFVVANGYDTTLFPTAIFLETAEYKDLFNDLRNKKHDKFLKAKGKGSYTSYFKKIKGSEAEKNKLKKWLDLPIGGISRIQAELYCNWLENFYNQFANRPNRSCYYEIRLPTKDELTTALKRKGVSISGSTDGQTNYRFIAFIHKR